MIDQLEKEIHEGMLDLYQHQSMSRERESLVYFYFAGIHNENITLKEEIERLKEEYMILQNASDEVEEEKNKEIERLNTNLKVANEDLTGIAQLLNLEEGYTIYDIEDKIKRLNKQLQLISDEFLKYDWETSSKEQTINQLKNLYNSIFKGSDKE